MLLVDTNVWLAANDQSSSLHGICARLLVNHRTELASTVPVIAETAWLLLDRLGPEAQVRFLTMVNAGDVEVIDLTLDDWQRVTELCRTYQSLRLDVIDASTIATAERLGQRVVATLDHRDFRVVRPNHCDALTLIPEILQP